MSARVLAVVTSHNRFDNVEKRTGLWLGELTHFHERIREAGHEMDVVSPQGGAVPIDEDSLGMRGGPQGANRAWNSDPQTRALLEDSKRPDGSRPATTRRSTSPAGTARCGTFRTIPA